jgi:dGTPase
VTDRAERFEPEVLFGAYRTEGQIDRDRIIYSPYFARLAEVTQVRSVDGFLVHNRLTHSLKVAQLARRLAESLNTKQPELAKRLGVDPDVTEAAGLAHDTGHPPFGHIAEEELDQLVRDKGVADGYEGNAQTFRILVKLSLGDTQPKNRAIAFLPGLNPTRATLNAVLKYPWLYSDRPPELKKWGAYETEKEVFEWARQAGAPSKRSAEAEIMDWADDITYAIHDMIDFHCAGLIPLHLLRPVVQRDDVLRPRNTREENTVFDSFVRRRKDKIADLEEYKSAFRQALRFTNASHPYEGTLEESRDLWAFTSVLIGNYMDAFSLVDPDKTGDGRCAEIKDHFKKQTTILKELTWRYVILHNDLATIQHGQRKAIRTLFDVFLDAINREQYQLFPKGFAELIKSTPAVPPARWTADYISSLTERELSKLHHRITSC